MITQDYNPTNYNLVAKLTTRIIIEVRNITKQPSETHMVSGIYIRRVNWWTGIVVIVRVVA